MFLGTRIHFMRLPSRLEQILVTKNPNWHPRWPQNAGYSISLEIIDIGSCSLALYIDFSGQGIIL